MNWAFFLSLLLPAFGGAETLSWEDCVALARSQNPAVLAAQKSVQASVFAERGSRSTYFPAINGTVSHGRSGRKTDTTDTNSQSYTLGLHASWNLFNGLADAARVDQAQAARLTAEETLREAKANASLELAQGFARLVHAQEYIKLADQIVKRREDNLSLVQLRFENGSENKGSLLLSQSNLSQAKLDALAARNALLTARAALAKAIGKDEREDFFVTGSQPVTAPPAQPAFEEIAKQTPDYVRSLASEKTADAAVKIARAGFLPTLGMSGKRERSGPTSFSGTDSWEAGITLTIPLFNGGRDYYATKSAVESRESAVLTTENRLRDKVLTLSQSFATFVEAVEREKVDTGFAEASSTRAMIARQKYNNGLISFEDWDGIENDLINRQKNLIQSQRDRVTAEAAWQQAQGSSSI
jgi:outer membrane protein TolC